MTVHTTSFIMRNAKENNRKTPFSAMKLARIKRFNHTPLAERRRKAYRAHRRVNLDNAYGGQFGNTYHR